MNKISLAFIVLNLAMSRFCHVLKIFDLLYLDATASCVLEGIWLNSAREERVTTYTHYSDCENDCLSRLTHQCVGWTFWASKNCDIFSDLIEEEYWKIETNAISGIRNTNDCPASASKL